MPCLNYDGNITSFCQQPIIPQPPPPGEKAFLSPIVNSKCVLIQCELLAGRPKINAGTCCPSIKEESHKSNGTSPQNLIEECSPEKQKTKKVEEKFINVSTQTFLRLKQSHKNKKNTRRYRSDTPNSMATVESASGTATAHLAKSAETATVDENNDKTKINDVPDNGNETTSKNESENADMDSLNKMLENTVLSIRALKSSFSVARKSE